MRCLVLALLVLTLVPSGTAQSALLVVGPNGLALEPVDEMLTDSQRQLVETGQATVVARLGDDPWCVECLPQVREEASASARQMQEAGQEMARSSQEMARAASEMHRSGEGMAASGLQMEHAAERMVDAGAAMRAAAESLARSDEWVDHPASFSIANAPQGTASRYEILLPAAYVESTGLLEAMTGHPDLYCLYVATDRETGDTMRLRAYYAFESAADREHWVTSASTQRWMDTIDAAGTLRERGEKPRDWGR